MPVKNSADGRKKLAILWRGKRIRKKARLGCGQETNWEIIAHVATNLDWSNPHD
jgi:hypothetical protein